MKFTTIIGEITFYKFDKFYTVLLKYVYKLCDFWFMTRYSQVTRL